MRPIPKEMHLEIRVDDLSVNFGRQGRTKSSKINRAILFRTVDKVLQIRGEQENIKVILALC